MFLIISNGWEVVKVNHVIGYILHFWSHFSLGNEEALHVRIMCCKDDLWIKTAHLISTQEGKDGCIPPSWIEVWNTLAIPLSLSVRRRTSRLKHGVPHPLSLLSRASHGQDGKEFESFPQKKEKKNLKKEKKKKFVK